MSLTYAGRRLAQARSAMAGTLIVTFVMIQLAPEAGRGLRAR